jgi:15-cis-phytoene synthase
MTDPENDLTPPQMLALAYARGDSRDFLALLLRYDRRLGAIIANGKEPLIGQMRLAWWRDVIARPAASRPLGEPLVAALTALEQAQGGGTAAAASMLLITDAWGGLLANEQWTTAVLADHLAARSAAIFGGYAAAKAGTGLRDGDVVTAGRYWAACSLPEYCQTAAQHDAVTSHVTGMQPWYRLPATLRPLTILAFAAARQHWGQGSNASGNWLSGLRLIVNALTGR